MRECAVCHKSFKKLWCHLSNRSDLKHIQLRENLLRDIIQMIPTIAYDTIIKKFGLSLDVLRELRRIHYPDLDMYQRTHLAAYSTVNLDKAEKQFTLMRDSFLYRSNLGEERLTELVKISTNALVVRQYWQDFIHRDNLGRWSANFVDVCVPSLKIAFEVTNGVEKNKYHARVELLKSRGYEIYEFTESYVLNCSTDLLKFLHLLFQEKNATNETTILYKRMNQISDVVPGKYPGDAGIDIKSIETVDIPSNDFANIRTGISLAIPLGWFVQLFPRSSFGKNGLQVHPGVIDAGFRGEITVFVYNHSNKIQTIREGDKVAQMLIHKVPDVKLQEVQELPESVRGENGFGSSGK